uniref:ATP synthase F0 subunit 8 n=1 Tax=Melasis buprestoides TaxID=195231 RepID=A0A343C378_9COLE|nr:ATP synthase F0 subunit 8 [Melasis buprestoides]
MSPLSWLTLFMFFIFIYLTLNTSNFYSFKYTSKSKFFNKNFKLISWKW